MASFPEITAEAQRGEAAALPMLTPISTSPCGGDSGDGCRTPTSEESKLPSVLECPRTPRKPPRRAAACGSWRKRRRLWRRLRPEIVSLRAEELEELFRWRDDKEARISRPQEAEVQ